MAKKAKNSIWMIEAYTCYGDRKVCSIGPLLEKPSDEDVNDAILAYIGYLPDGLDEDDWVDEPVYSCVGEFHINKNIKEWLKSEKLDKELKVYKAERLQFKEETKDGKDS